MLTAHGEGAATIQNSPGASEFHAGFNAKFEKMLDVYERWVQKTLDRRAKRCLGFLGSSCLSFVLFPFVGVSFFPRTDAGQFVINVKAPTGTRIEVTEDYVKRVENIVRQVVRAGDLDTVVSNIGVTPDLSALFTPNSGMHTAFVEVGLQGRSQGRQLRLHGRSPPPHGCTSAGIAHLFSVWRPGGFRSEPRHARAN